MARKQQEQDEEKKGGMSDTYAAAVEYSRRIWLAGLGAMSRTGTEGKKLFDTLVKEGEQVEANSRKRVGENIDEAMRKATSRWDNVETMFEERVGKTLSSLGVATNDEIRNLSKQVQELNKQVKELSGRTH